MNSNNRRNNENLLAEVPLAGYTDRLSARPGDTVKFYLSKGRKKDDDEDTLSSSSTTTTVTVRARLTESISADPNPLGPGIIENDASIYFKKRTIEVRHQSIPRGSFAQTSSNIISSYITGKSSSIVKKIAIDIWFFPTLISSSSSAAAAAAATRGASLSSSSSPSSSSPSVQNIWSWGEGFRLDLLSSGYLLVTYDINNNNNIDQEQEQTTKNVCTGSKILKQRRWYHISCALIVGDDNDDDNRCIVKCHLSVKNKDDEDTLFTSNAVAATAKASCTLDIDAPFTIAMGGRLNGRIEDPVIRITEKDADKKEFILASWDTSFYSSKEDPWTIPCNDGAIVMDFIKNKNKNVASLILYNHPTRGVKGRRWDGTEFCWKNCPKHYGAIHFHDDDVYDFKWISNMEWKVPMGIPSGIYIMRFVTTNDDDDCQEQHQHEEALPLFICAPKKKKDDDNFDSSSSDIQQPPQKLMKTNRESKPTTTTCSEIKKNKLVVLIPTFTYVMYGNHNRPDFGTYYQTVKYTLYSKYKEIDTAKFVFLIFVSKLDKFNFFYLFKIVI
jgi:N,N-dimethylformamidase